MIRKASLAMAAMLFPIGLILVTAPGSALAGGLPKATGIANCHISTGAGVVTPGLTPVGSAHKVKIVFSASLTFASGPCGNANVTSPPGVTILGGTVTGTGVYVAPAGTTANACPNFDGPDILKHFDVKVDWKTSGPAIAPTKLVYKGNSGSVSGAPTDNVTLDMPPAATAGKAGSFLAPSTLHTVQLDTTLPGPGCGGGPFMNFGITGGVVTV